MQATSWMGMARDEDYRRLVHAINDYAIYMLDPEGRVASWNAGAQRFKGYTADEIVGRHFSTFYTEQDRASGEPLRALATALSEGKFEKEGWRLRKDGTRFWAHVVIDPLYEEGRLIGFAKITRDRTEQREVEHEARESERRFRVLVEGIADYAIYMLDPEGRVTNWNAGAQRFKGYTADEIVGRHFSTFYTEEDRASGEPLRALAAALSEGKFEKEGWRLRKDGTRFWAHVVIDPLYEEGRLIGFAKITRDRSRQKEDRERIADISTKLELALSSMSQALCLFDAEGRLLLCNERLREAFPDAAQPGRASEGKEPSFTCIIAAICARLLPEETAEAQLAEAQRIAAAHAAALLAQPSVTLVESFGAEQRLSFAHRRTAEGGWVMTITDVSEQYRARSRIAHMARHDMLTGLPNRAHLQEELDRMLAACGQERGELAVVALDLNRFKEINDRHGHAMGDAVLRALAERLAGAVRQGELAGRVGGDEFIIAAPLAGPEAMADLARRLREALREPLTVEDMELPAEASIGIALFPRDGTTREVLLNNADLAMYRAKTLREMDVCFYEPSMDEAARARRAMAHDLWEALETLADPRTSQFEIYYQEQRAIAGGQVVGQEALLRWRHPERGFVSPAEFIPVAEECGAILRLGEWVLRQVCAEVAAWSVPQKVAVNVSPMQLAHGNLTGLVREVLAESGLPPERLELEITESTLMADKLRALRLLEEIKALGVTIAIDDFGTGYSSLDTLRTFPFDKIKLDRSFMLEIEQSPKAKALMRAVLALGRSLEVSVLAEGVETEEQYAILRAENCTEVQGYLFGRPRPLPAAGPAANESLRPAAARTAA